ncbi:ABC transporter substrate-binding protein [Salisediminibacterium selenitireducens]|uniref:ABC-type nitrate/sulfonate/bicarbonate transport systems periplasmic components-like protein n=1 Tax=Bacillus selenitireducens (strain ATCC 700615 / DSM 15326 / MLS10) TaxID=439292 RepID=D6XYC9_BACIE|nr:ABC transporter substrate-binding protein [Salisediminibacterium selenitireducens]ADI00198.1 ABC-type nitrate/sulfonate/bicarbonate transport systems periplasmic components-like protein [[Bacillus] selenitireducens MLS10]
MKRSNRTVGVMMIGTMIMSACGAPAPGEDDVIRIGHLPITHAAPLYFVKEFEDELLSHGNIELVRFSSWIELMDALNAGRIDGASVLFELAMKAKERGIDLSAVALGHREGNAIVAAHDITDPADLRGETVAIPHTLSAHHLLLDEMLREAGVDYEEVNIVEMPPPEMPAALSEGRIASYIVAEPFGALGVTLDAGHVLYQSDQFCPGSCLCCALVLRDDFMEEAPELSDAFLTAYLEAGVMADAMTEEAMRAHQNHLNVDEETLSLSLAWIDYGDLSIGEAEYEHLRSRLIDMDLSDEPPAFSDFVDQSAFEESR